MKNPLFKRLPRELKTDIGKYIALFLFLTLTIGFISGFLVAGGSTYAAYEESFEKYSIENGHFTLVEKAEQKTIETIEKEGVLVYELFSKDKALENGHTLRMYMPRTDVDRVDLMKGELPSNADEIAIDRLYAANNGIEIGDSLLIASKNFTVCGFVALSDYSALFKNNTDMMFDANKFTVSIVTEEGFYSVDDAGLRYTYAWLNDDRSLDESEQKNFSEKIMETIAGVAVLEDFVASVDNSAIIFTGDDMGGDTSLSKWLLYITITILAFAFAITTRNTVEQEASVIGTLLASGYSKMELLGHYLVLPLSVTVVSALIGNILGYTLFKNVVANMYYHSYSLPTYVTRWNAEAFLLTTIIPIVIILAVNLVVLISVLSLSPLKFLRHDFKKKKSKRAVKLPDFKFINRFRIRILLQNRSAYLVLFAGIFFSNVLLLFGLMFLPLLDSFKKEVQNSKISEYQYVLKVPFPTETEGVEKYLVTSLINSAEEEITIYGISENSEYLDDINFSESGVVFSDGFMEKYSIDIGDTVKLSEKYDGNEYSFKANESYHYPATLAVFMTEDMFRETFDVPDEYFSGYFSNKKIEDIDDIYIASIITEQDLTIVSDQLENSMGVAFHMFKVFAIVLFVLMIYLLAKMVIDRNTYSISMLKILGYSNREAGGLYNSATMVAVLISLLLTIPLSELVLKLIYKAMMMEYTGWLTYYVAPWVYAAMFIIGAACYIFVHIIEMKRIRKIPMTQALKNLE